MTALSSVFEATALRVPERTALVLPGQRTSFAALAARARAFADQAAARGIGKGDRVLVAMPLGPELYAVLAGLWRRGAVAVFPEPAMGLDGLRHALRATEPCAIVAAGRYRWLKLLPALWQVPMIVPGVDHAGDVPQETLGPDDPALISFTSGSTGAPKGIVRSHGFLMAQHRAVLDLLGSDEAEIDLVGFPVFVLVNLAVGRTSVLPDWPMSRQDRVRGKALARWIVQSGATRALLPPSLCAALAEASVPRSLTSLFTGGGPVKPALVDRLKTPRPDLRIVSVYGSTEAEPIAELDWAEVTGDDRAEMAAGGGLLVGRPAPGLSLRIKDDEIEVAGPHVNDGYLDPSQDAETKRREGARTWHRTGDAGRIDAQGRLWLLGRRAEVLRRDGVALYPFAIELQAERLEGVKRAAFVDIDGSAVLAYEGDPDAAVPLSAALAPAGVDRIAHLSRLPLDRRHRSKIDYPTLRVRLR